MTLLAEVPVATLRVVLADPDALARRSVRDALAGGTGTVTVADAGTARDAIALVRYHRPEVLLAESRQPDMPGEELCRRVGRDAPGTAVVMLGALEDPGLAVRCLRAGAAGYLTKDLDPAALPRILRGVVAGEAAVSRRMAMHLVDALRSVPEGGWRPVRSRLTSREWEIVDLLGEGASTDAIAQRLVLSHATVYSHVKSVLAKLGVHSRSEAVPAAMRLRREEAACAPA
jgi:DNA-binding NarL/FixJ family response regulator